MIPVAGDRWSKNRAADYFDNLLQNDPLKLFRKYSVHAADNPTGHTVATTDIRQEGLRGDYFKGSVPNDKIISYLHLLKYPKTANYVPNSSSLMEGGDTIDCQASNTVKANWVPAYFLPWKPQAVVWMTIPRRGQGANGQPDPDIFFTAAINGCSVLFQGSMKSPIVYHCGGDPEYRPNPTMKTVNGFNKPVRDPTEAAAFWRSLAEMHGDQHGVISGEVNKDPLCDGGSHR